MRTMPGAPVHPSNVVGRDELIERIWEMLDKQSVLLTAERRIGKTSIIKKMQQECGSRLAFFRDVWGLRSPAEFADAVFQDVERHLKIQARAATGVREFLRHIGGTEFQGIKLPEVAASHWKEILRRCVEDLTGAEDIPVVFFWDEIPWMLGTIAKEHGETVAMEVLDVLRALRQTYSGRLRMVFTGSIGLHHILADLQDDGYKNSPINDLCSFEVPPLEPRYGSQLALLLLRGERIPTKDADEVAVAVSEGVGNIAFYIHHVVEGLKSLPGEKTAQDVAAVVQSSLVSPQDPWDLGHFTERLSGYYRTQAILAGQLLDILAVASNPMRPSNVSQLLPPASAVNPDEVRELLKLLARDHYLERHTDGAYSFRYEILRRWWVLERDL